MLPLGRFRVEDDSMRPTLEPGDFVLVNRWAYRFRKPAEGDVVVLRSPEGPNFLIKRIANVVDATKVFVVGDNPQGSRDSRHFGPVDRRALLGKVWLTARP
ncbi:MAG TPA: nickel-type superoxide dismutase maturation protease [Thermoplasmata archaeon]